MLLQALGGPRPYRLRPRIVEDGYGDPVEDWSEPERTLLFHGIVQEVSSEEEDGTRRLVSSRRRLVVRGKADLTPADRIELDGAPWLVDGEPTLVRPRLGVPFTVAELRRLT